MRREKESRRNKGMEEKRKKGRGKEGVERKKWGKNETPTKIY